MKKILVLNIHVKHCAKNVSFVRSSLHHTVLIQYPVVTLPDFGQICLLIHYTKYTILLPNCTIQYHAILWNTTQYHATGWQKLRNRSIGGAQKVRISMKGRVPNIRYFVANSHFNERLLTFIEISTKGFLLS